MPKNIKEFVNDGYDKIVSVENDIKKIQQRPEMYVGTGKSGCIQLCHEGINNAIDECTNPESCGENIEVVFTDNKGKTSLYVADDGKVEEIATAYKDGCLVVELEHFSEYVIVKNVIEPVVVGDNANIWLWVACIMCSAAVVSVIRAKSRKYV